MAIKVFLLDDHEVVRRGLADVLESTGEFEVVGEAGTAEQALNRLHGAGPDVAVLDVRLPDGNGIEVCREIRSRFPEVKCLMLTSFSDDEALVDAAMAGAQGYVLKEIRGIGIVDDEHREIAALTAQERRIFDLIGQGKSNRQIAEELYLAEKTVKNYVSNLLTKLGMTRRTQAAAMAARLDERKTRRTYE